MSVTVIKPGALTTIQDRGRPGFAHLGVPTSGALDLPALDLANALVGNALGTACLECTLKGPTLRFDRSARFVLTGADVPAELDGVEVEHGKPHTAAAGTTLRIGSATTGVRTYLALEGGIAVDPVLGSMSADTLSGIGPAPLSVGDVLPLGNSRGEECRTVAGIAPGPLRLGLGPRHDRFEPAALDAILNEPFTVSPTSNRIGLRLTGPLLGWATHTELRSEGIATGSVQVPPNGQPIVMLADHPTTGGYPVIGVIDSGSLALAAQLRPGTEISFVLTA